MPYDRSRQIRDQCDRGVDRYRPALDAALAGCCWPRRRWLFLLVFFVYPVAAIIGLGLAPGGSSTSQPARRHAGPAIRPRGRLVHAVAGGAIDAADGRCSALPAAWVFARFDFPGRRLLSCAHDRAVRAAHRRGRVGLPRPARATQPAPPIRLDRTIWARSWPPTSSTTSPSCCASWAGSGRTSTRASRRRPGCWAPPWRAFREVTLAAADPAIASAASIVFLFTFTSFGVVLLLGGPRVHDARGRDLPPDGASAQPAQSRPRWRSCRWSGLTVLLFAYARLQDRLAIRTTTTARPGSTSRPARTRASARSSA